MPPKHGSVVALIDTLLKEANASDEELSKEASNLDLAGDAKSTHPSANVDDKTKPAAEGSRSSENEADVKKDVPNSINNPDTENTDAKGNEGATVNGDQGTTTMAADSGLKGNVDSPKKDHSGSMSDSGPGDGSDTFKGDWDKASAASALVGEANALLADVAMLSGEPEAPSTPAPTPEQDAQKSAADSGQSVEGDEAAEVFKKAAEQFPEDVEAGYTAAALLAQQMGLMKEGSEIDEVDATRISGIQKTASDDADNYVVFLRGYADLMQKAAMPMGAPPPEALAALAGEGDAGGEMGEEEMAEGAGEEDVGAALEGLGGAEEGAGAEEEAGGGEEEAIMQLLADSGIDLEELQALLANQPGGGEEAVEAEEAAPEVA